ncbi:MAG: DNA-protecting protein DprA [Proteobacteria bacterium]|nr:DNA-protecting protein DprA [Pseudomonadota bacterium]MCC6912173.1 DNA-protecting protein DprA [Rhodospirillaceae bacterium]
MAPQAALAFSDLDERAISPFLEMGAYEYLWDNDAASFKSIAEKFAAHPNAIPSDFVPTGKALEKAAYVRRVFAEAGIKNFGVRVHGAGEYPQKLRVAQHPVELLYYQGWWDLVESRSVAVVGTREPSPEGLARTRKLVRHLVEDDFTIVSGLAKGVDTEAHTTAIAAGGRTIAVIGTPLSHTYPKTNVELQKRLAEEYLVISQVPLSKYERQDYRKNRLFFPERNVTMSALTEATIIVEAGETSGTLIQAKAALQQGRKLFILDSCFRDPKLTWPAKFAQRGAIRVSEYDDIKRHLSTTSHAD